MSTVCYGMAASMGAFLLGAGGSFDEIAEMEIEKHIVLENGEKKRWRQHDFDEIAL